MTTSVNQVLIRNVMYLVVINPWINTYNWLVSGVLVHILIRHLNRFRDPAVPRFVRSAKLWARKLKAKRCTLGGSLRICSSWSFHVWQYLMLVYWRVKKTISFGFFYFLTLITESSGLFSSFLHHPLNFMWAVFKTVCHSTILAGELVLPVYGLW